MVPVEQSKADPRPATGAVHERRPQPGPASRSASLTGARRLLAPRRPTALELLVAAAVLLGLGELAFASSTVHAGFLAGDWTNAAKTAYAANCCGPGTTGASPDLPGALAAMRRDGPVSAQPGAAVLAALAHWVLGGHTGLHLALAVALAALLSALAYALLRRLGAEPVPSALVALLSLLFPYAASTRLWPSAGLDQVAPILVLAGVLLAVGGLRRTGARAVARHGAALVLYALAVLVLDTAAGLVAGAVVLYLVAGSGLRRAAPRFVADVVVALLALWAAGRWGAPQAPVTLADRTRGLHDVAGGALTVFASAVLPFATLPRIGVAVLAVALVGGAAWIARRRAARDPLRDGLRRWLIVAAAALVWIVAAYLLAVPVRYGTPVAAGLGDRVNLLAGPGFAVLLVALAMLAGLLIAVRFGRGIVLAQAVAALALLVVLAGDLHRLGDAKAAYVSAHAQEQPVLAAIARGRPYRTGAVLYTFGHPALVAPGVPVFAGQDDETSAVKVTLRDPSLAAYPVLPGTALGCAPVGVIAGNPYASVPPVPSPYGGTYFLDVPSGRTQLISDARTCRRALASFHPGPLAPGGLPCRLVGAGPAAALAWLCATDPRSTG